MSVFEHNHYYHQQVKRMIIAFGELFTGISIKKQEKSGKKYQEYPVPVAYAPKNKWVSRTTEQPDLMAPQVEITLPRITFEMAQMRYAPERKIGFNGAYVVGNIGGVRSKLFSPAPWDVTFNMYSYTKDQTDSLQILEQILPYFQPFMTLNYEVLPEYQIKKDVPVTLIDTSIEDSYEGSPDNMRQVIQTFSFNFQLDLFGPVPASGKVIKEAFINVGFLFPNPPTMQFSATVTPREANKYDAHTIIEATRHYK